MTSEAYKRNLSQIDWSDFKPRQRAPRIPPARSSLACPQLVRPFSDPVQSMANGKWYDDPAGLRSSYRAENNPAGVDYIEMGNERVTFQEKTFNEQERRDDIRQSLHDVMNGKVSAEVAAIE